jgi:hypothetical protein
VGGGAGWLEKIPRERDKEERGGNKEIKNNKEN